VDYFLEGCFELSVHLSRATKQYYRAKDLKNQFKEQDRLTDFVYEELKIAFDELSVENERLKSQLAHQQHQHKGRIDAEDKDISALKSEFNVQKAQFGKLEELNLELIDNFIQRRFKEGEVTTYEGFRRIIKKVLGDRLIQIKALSDAIERSRADLGQSDNLKGWLRRKDEQLDKLRHMMDDFKENLSNGKALQSQLHDEKRQVEALRKRISAYEDRIKTEADGTPLAASRLRRTR
jgi:hypothetical protein